MSEPEQGGSGWGLVVAAVVGLIVLAAGGVVVLKMVTAPAPSDEVVISRRPAKQTQAPPAITPQLMSTPGKAAVVKLTALGEGGTWYMIDEDICEGDAALTGMIQDRIARDKAARGSPADYSYPVRFEVADGAGIGAEHVAAARKAVEAAGARVVEGAKP